MDNAEHDEGIADDGDDASATQTSMSAAQRKTMFTPAGVRYN